jgi:hypothetical protein
MALRDIELDGRLACAQGLRKTQNPYCFSRNMPKKTGEPLFTWQTKVYAWDFGWDNASNEQSIVGEKFIVSEKSLCLVSK